MANTDPASRGESGSQSRRTILIGFGATALALTGVLARFAWPASAANFMELSAILTARTDLDRQDGMAIYRAMSGADPAFPRKVGELVRRLRRGAAAGAQTGLREMGPGRGDLTDAARAILAAWYLGVLHTAAGRQQVLSASALVRRLASDVLPFPSSCGPSPAAWSARPPRA